jgi:DNA-binding transcriptional LysR family regulator
VFLVVYETGSFSAAAGKLHMTQPGVSQQIRALENHLGTPLFIRRGHGVELTAAGIELLEPARQMLNMAETTERMLKSRRGEVSGRIRLGCALPSGTYIVYPWINQFRSKYPDVVMQIDQIEPGPLIGALRAHELDGGLVLGRLRGRGLVHHKLAEDPVTLIVPLNHPWTWPAELGRTERMDMDARLDRQQPRNALDTGLAHAPDTHPPHPLAALANQHDNESWAPAVKVSMLKDQPVILEHSIGESRSDARRALNDALEDRGISVRDLKVVLELPSPMAVACAVAEGLGVGLVPQSIARRLVGQVVPVRIEGFSLVQHIYLVHDRKALHTPAVSAWWKFIESHVQRGSQEAHQEAQSRPGHNQLAGTDTLHPEVHREAAKSIY